MHLETNGFGMDLYKYIGTGLSACAIAISAFAQEKPMMVESREWYRDGNHEIAYKDWKPYPCATVDNLAGFKAKDVRKLDVYGGEEGTKRKATGFFRTEEGKDGRWTLVDPLGNRFYALAVNGLRQGKAPSNQSAFSQRFRSEQEWLEKTKSMFDSTGFNMAGSWSDLANITAHNKKAKKPIVYCTQLSLLGSYSQKMKKKTGNKGYHELAYVYNEGFAAHCKDKMKEMNLSTDDPNLFGHFSDNELPFQENLLKAFIAINDPADMAYQAAAKWAADNKVDAATADKEQTLPFNGEVALKYYSVVSNAIKSIDPNHLYIGSRLHASVKSNPAVLAAAVKYADVVSINYYGEWELAPEHRDQWETLAKPYMITEFYTKAEDTKMANLTGAGWLVRTQKDRGLHYQNFGLALLRAKHCVGWHWFRYQDNAPDDAGADASNKDSNKGMVDTRYQPYPELIGLMGGLNNYVYPLLDFYDKK